MPASLPQFPGSWITALVLYNFNSCNSSLSVTHFPDYVSFIEFQGLLIETQPVVFPFFFNKQLIPYTGIPRFIVLCFVALHRRCIFLQLEIKTLHQQKGYDSLYCDTRFTLELHP